MQKDIVNRNGTITIKGIDFDNPIGKELNKWDFHEIKEGSKLIKELWLDTYITEGKATYRWSYSLKMTNRGKCTLDDSTLSGEDLEKANYIFSNLK